MQPPIELEVTRVQLDKTFSGTLPHCLFLQDFQPVPQQKKGR